MYETPDIVTLEKRISDATRAGDAAGAIDALASSWTAVSAQHGARLRLMLQSIPEEAWADDPWMLAAMGASYRSLDSPSRSAALPWFRTAEAKMAASGTPEPDVAAVRVHLAASLRSLGQLDDAVAAASSAVSQLDRDVTLSATLRIRDQARAALQLGIAQLHAGDLDSALAKLRLALGLSERNLTRAELVECLGALGVHKLYSGDLVGAADYAATARELAGDTGLLCSQFGAAALATEALIAVEQNRAADAAGLLPQIAAAGYRNDWEPLAEYTAAAIALAEGRRIEGLHHLRLSLGSTRTWQGTPLVRAMAGVLRGVFLVHLGEYRAATAALEAIEPSCDHGVCPARFVAGIRFKAADSSGCLEALTACLELGEAHSPRTVVDVLLLSAAAHYDLENAAGADVAVDRALLLASTGSLRLPFLMIPPATLQRILTRATDRAQPPEVHELLHHLRARDGSLSGDSLEPLSERELDIAQHLIEDKTVSQIASDLYISANTVKTHVRSIYRKLSANNRQDAVRRVKELGLHEEITPH